MAGGLMGLSALIALAFGCGPSTATGAAPRSPLAKTTRLSSEQVYDSRARNLFDDGIDPRAIRTSGESPPSRLNDSLLRERARQSDVIARVKVDTVTALHPDEGHPEFELHVRTIEVLADRTRTAPKLRLVVTSDSAAHGIVNTYQGRLMGSVFVAFLRAFTNPDGSSVTHFHFSPDTNDFNAAVVDAITLTEAGPAPVRD